MKTSAPSDNVTAVERALALLDAFTIDDAHLNISELGRRTKLPKTSALRLARTLAASGYLVQLENGAWRLGPATAWLGARYQVAIDIHNTIEPVLQDLVKATGKNASFFVYEGNIRIRLAFVKNQEAATVTRRVGEAMPLDQGAPGKVILAFSGHEGKIYDEIRKRGFHITIGEALSAAASIAAPVFGARWSVVGALTLGCPANSLSEQILLGHSDALQRAARMLSNTLSMNANSAQPLKLAMSTWHP